MKNTLKLIASITILTMLSACASINHSVLAPQDELALQDMQTRDFESNQKIAFASVLSVLQDVGYIVEAADGNSGLITAKSPSSSGISYNLLWGFGKKNAQTRVTAFVEPIGSEISKIRLNFVTNTADTNLYGASSVDKPVEDPAVYNAVFERVAEAIFVRQSLTE